jgi:hypothetical protein
MNAYWSIPVMLVSNRELARLKACGISIEPIERVPSKHAVIVSNDEWRRALELDAVRFATNGKNDVLAAREVGIR